jgi:ferritin-like metal-binding protein YciE
MARTKKLADLFHDTLKDVYFAEKKILSTLPKMAKAAQHPDLKAAFKKHHGETEGQIERLEQVFDEIDQKPQGSWTNIRGCPRMMPGCWLPLRPLNIMR